MQNKSKRVQKQRTKSGTQLYGADDRIEKKNNQKKDLENHFYGESYCTYSIKSRKQGFKPGPNCNNSDLIPTENRLLPCQKDIFDFIKN